MVGQEHAVFDIRVYLVAAVIIFVYVRGNLHFAVILVYRDRREQGIRMPRQSLRQGVRREFAEIHRNVGAEIVHQLVLGKIVPGDGLDLQPERGFRKSVA